MAHSRTETDLTHLGLQGEGYQWVQCPSVQGYKTGECALQ